MKAWHFWVRLLSTRERGTTLACFRVAVACVLVYSLSSVALADLLEPLWVDVRHGGMRTLRASWLVDALGGPTPRVIWSLFWSALASALLLLIGLGGRLTSFCLLQLYMALVSLNGDASGGYDDMLTNALWLLTLGSGTATLSLDSRLRTGAWTSGREVATWPRYLMVFQILLVYTATGLRKTSILWTPAGGYSALYYVSQDPTWCRFGGEAFAALYPLTQLATAVTWHWEQPSILLLGFYYFRYTRDRPGRLRRLANRWDLRVPWMAVGIVLHLGILVLLDVGPFSPIALAYYLTLWSPDEIEGAGRRVTAVLRRFVLRRLALERHVRVMPRLGSSLAAARIRERSPEVPIVFMSGYAFAADLGVASLAGASQLEKPFGPDALLRRVREALDGRKR